MLEEKNTILKDKKVLITTATGEVKILTLKMDYLDDDAKMIVQAIHFKMLKQQKDQLEAAIE